MPGVPSGRACEACRKQKKKCNQETPACSRCVRLQIECVGSGKQRFIFKDESCRHSSVLNRRRLHIKTIEDHDFVQAIFPPPPPSNDLNKLTLAFTAAVMISTDLRYSLSWAYGGFLADVPRRLGTSNALDAASRALIASHLCFSSPGRVISPHALSEYTKAIRALRITLDDPREACSASTLCAVNILLITQGFIGVTGKSSVSHCQGAAKILKARGIRYNTEDEFECGLFFALRGPVIFEGLFNRKIHFTRDEWDQLVQNDYDKLTGSGLMMHCLARVPGIVDRGKEAFRCAKLDEILDLHNEAQDLYESLLRNVDELQNHYRGTQRHPSPFPEISDQIFSTRLFAHWQRTYGLALTIAMFFNCILRSLTLPPNQTINLELEAAQLVSDTIAVAGDAAMFRPLGSSYIVLCLVAAWNCAATVEVKVLIEEILEDYLTDFPGRQQQHNNVDLGMVARHFDLRFDERFADRESVNSGDYEIC